MITIETEFLKWKTVNRQRRKQFEASEIKNESTERVRGIGDAVTSDAAIDANNCSASTRPAL